MIFYKALTDTLSSAITQDKLYGSSLQISVQVLHGPGYTNSGALSRVGQTGTFLSGVLRDTAVITTVISEEIVHLNLKFNRVWYEAGH